MAFVISFQLVPDSAQHGVVTYFNESTAQYVFDPEDGFEGIASFQYESFCDGESIGIITQYVPVGNSGEIPPIATSVSPFVVIVGNCLDYGTVEITAIASTVGIIRVYNKNNTLVATKNLTSNGSFKITLPTSNVWDAYYLTLTELDKLESRPSNIITFCPKAPVTPPIPCCGVGCCSGCKSCC